MNENEAMQHTTDEEQHQQPLEEPGALADALEETDPALATPEESEPAEEQTASVATLVVKRNGAETTDIFPVNPPATIGRFDPSVGPIDVDLGPLPEGVYVSRKHARISHEDGMWKIKDLGSSNGTFVLGANDFERIEEAELENETELALGNARFVFRLSGAEQPE